MNPSNVTLHVHGQVRTSQSGMGMAISFTGLTPEDFEKLRKLAQPDAAPPEPTSVASPPKTATVSSSPQPVIAASPPATAAVEPESEFSQDLTHSDPGDVNQSVVAGAAFDCRCPRSDCARPFPKGSPEPQRSGRRAPKVDDREVLLNYRFSDSSSLCSCYTVRLSRLAFLLRSGSIPSASGHACIRVRSI
jgi:hypothetical protein